MEKAEYERKYQTVFEKKEGETDENNEKVYTVLLSV